MYSEIKQIVEVLRKGGIILYPTDTIWGIGCDATNSEAVKRIYELKKRADNKSMLVLVDTENCLGQYVKNVPDIACQLIEVADKPLTIIYPEAKNLASNLIASDGSIGIRVVRDEFCADIITRLGRPLVSTSANISGEPSAAIFSEISEEIKKGVDYVVKYRQADTSKANASSIMKLEVNGTFKIIRP